MCVHHLSHFIAWQFSLCWQFSFLHCGFLSKCSLYYCCQNISESEDDVWVYTNILCITTLQTDTFLNKFYESFFSAVFFLFYATPSLKSFQIQHKCKYENQCPRQIKMYKSNVEVIENVQHFRVLTNGLSECWFNNLWLFQQQQIGA